MRLVKAKTGDMPLIYAQMEKNFVREEIRDYEDALEVSGDGRYTVYHVEEDGTRVGFMCVWSLTGFAFLEHFVIYDKFRGKGCGGRAFDILYKKSGLLVLECEPPEDGLKARRVEFYKRHKMVWNNDEYFQPPYRKGGEGCALKLMSSKPLTDFKGIVRELYREVYKVEYEE